MQENINQEKMTIPSIASLPEFIGLGAEVLALSGAVLERAAEELLQ